MALRLGFLMACLAAARSLASMQQRIGLVLLQQRVQRLEPVKTTFGQALLEAERQGAEEKEEFKAIEEKIFALKTNLTEERKLKLPRYAKALLAAKKEARAVQLMNADIKLEIEEVNLYNDQMREKVLTLKQESAELATEVGKLRTSLSGTMEVASTALESIKNTLDTQAINIQNIKTAHAHHSLEISLLGIGASQPQTHASPNPFLLGTAASQPVAHASPNPLEQASSLQERLKEVVQLSNDQNNALEAAFNNDMAETSAERNEYLRIQSHLNLTLADAKSTRDQLSAAARHFEATKQQLISLRSLFQQTLPEVAEKPTLATKSEPVEHLAVDKAEAAAIQKDAFAEAVPATKWAEMAFQIKGSQDDYDTVMKADEADREAAYNLIKNGPEKAAADKRQPAAIRKDAFAKALPTIKDTPAVMPADDKTTPEEPAITSTYWADMAFQIKGSPDDYATVMKADEADREAAYNVIKFGPEKVAVHQTEPAALQKDALAEALPTIKAALAVKPADDKATSEDPAIASTYWADMAFQIKGSSDDYATVMKADEADREAAYNAIKVGPEKGDREAAFNAIKATPDVKPADDKATSEDPAITSTYWADMAFQIKGSSSDYATVMKADKADREAAYNVIKNGLEKAAVDKEEPATIRKDAFAEALPTIKATPAVTPADDKATPEAPAITSTYWADMAFQIKGSSADYATVMKADEADREAAYNLLKNGPEKVTVDKAETLAIQKDAFAKASPEDPVITSTYWADMAFQIKGSSDDYALVMKADEADREAAYNSIKIGTETFAADKAEPAAIQKDALAEALPTIKAALAVKPADDKATPEDSAITSTYWADMAFQIKGSSDDYATVMKADVADREAAYNLLKDGPEKVAADKAERAAIQKDAFAEALPTIKATPDVKPDDEKATPEDLAITSTYWADMAFQIKGSSDDYATVMKADEADREAAYNLIKNGPEKVAADKTEPASLQKDAFAEAASATKSTPAVEPADDMATPEDSDNGNEKKWMSEEAFHLKYGSDHVDILLESGFLSMRQNPDIPLRTQYKVNDEEGVRWLNEPDLSNPAQ